MTTHSYMYINQYNSYDLRSPWPKHDHNTPVMKTNVVNIQSDERAETRHRRYHTVCYILVTDHAYYDKINSLILYNHLSK